MGRLRGLHPHPPRVVSRAAPVRAAPLYHAGMRLKTLFFLVPLILVGCCRDRYELVPIGEGAVYRLDKQTGEVRLYAGRRAFDIYEIEEAPSKK